MLGITRPQSAILAGGAALTALGMGLITPVLPWYAQSLGASATLVGLLLAGFGFSRLIISPPTVWLSRRVNPRLLLVGSPAVTALVAVLCAVVGGFFALALFCVVEGALAAVYATTGMGMVVSRANPERRGRSIGVYQAAGLLGASVGPALGGLIGQQFGLRAPFLLYAALAAFAAWWLNRQLDRSILPLHSESKMEMPKEKRPIRQNLFTPGLLALWLVTFAFVFARVGTQLVALPLLGAWRLELSQSQVGLALSLSSLAALAIFYPAGWLADRVGRKAVIALSGIGMAGALAIFADSRGYITFVLAALLLGAGSGLAGPAPAAYLADTIPVDDRLAGIGVYRMFGDAGAALAPPLLGWLTDRGGYGMALLVTAALLLSAVVNFTWLTPANLSVYDAKERSLDRPIHRQPGE